MQKFEFSEPKFYEMVVFILDEFRDDDSLGRIKLAKLVYNSDFRAMRRLGRPITGATYFKDTFGHNPTELLMTELDLVASGDAREIRGGEDEPRTIEANTQRRLLLREGRKPDLRRFTPDELVILREVVEEYRETPGIALSDESHKTIGWRVADWKERIPYETVFLADPSDDDLAHAAKVAAERDLDFAPLGD